METQPQHLSQFVTDVFRLAVWLILLMLVFVPLEKIFALHRQKTFRKAFGADIILYFINGLVPKLLLILPITLIAGAVHRFEPSVFYTWAEALPFWLRVAAALVVGEIGAYWGHRWSHELPLLWRFHAVHHSAEEMDWLVNSKVHPVDILFTRLCALIPMYVLGLAQPMSNQVDLVPLLVSIAATAWGFFVHANVNWRFGPLEWLIATPAFHHWHHTNDDPRLINKNYSAMLPFLDKCFGTLYLPGQWPEKYGVAEPMPSDLKSQLLNPFNLPPPDSPPPAGIASSTTTIPTRT